MKYLPFLTGKYSTAPGLVPISKVKDTADSLIFQIDDTYQEYIGNKHACRQEKMGKYYCEKRLWNTSVVRINQFILSTLLKEYDEMFKLLRTDSKYTFINQLNGDSFEWDYEWKSVRGNHYQSLFDALCSQVQEDLAICQMDHNQDWLAALHLCAPNHWSAEDKIGHPFTVVHGPVPDMEKTKLQSHKMLQSVVQKGPFTRFAWGISTDNRLNHHPVPREGTNADEWHGRKPLNDRSPIYIRSERQTLVGFPEVQAFLFTIRTYFYDVESLLPEEKTALLESIESMSPETIQYKGLERIIPVLKAKYCD